MIKVVQRTGLSLVCGILFFFLVANINNMMHIFLVYLRGIHSVIRRGFSPFLSLHCMVRFGQNHYCVTPQFFDHMCSAVRFDIYIMVRFVGFELENF